MKAHVPHSCCSHYSLASSLMAELEVVWKEWKEVLKQKTLWFEGEVLNALQQDGAERKKELTKAFQGLKEYQVKDKVQDRRRAAEKETASSIQNELEMTRCKLEGNVTRLAMENARQVKTMHACVCNMFVVRCVCVYVRMYIRAARHRYQNCFTTDCATPRATELPREAPGEQDRLYNK